MSGTARAHLRHSHHWIPDGRLPVSTVMSARAGEHRYFLAAAIVLTFLVLWAFGFEYRDLMHPSQFTVLVQVHGLVMFAWVGLFLTQVALIVWHRPR